MSSPSHIFEQTRAALISGDASAFISSLSAIHHMMLGVSAGHNKHIMIGLQAFLPYLIGMNEQGVGQHLGRAAQLLSNHTNRYLENDALDLACRLAVSVAPQELLALSHLYMDQANYDTATSAVYKAISSAHQIDWLEHRQTLLDIVELSAKFDPQSSEKKIETLFSESLYESNDALCKVLAQEGLLSKPQCFWAVAFMLKQSISKPDKNLVTALCQAGDVSLAKMLDEAKLDRKDREGSMSFCTLWDFETALHYTLSDNPSLDTDQSARLALSIVKFCHCAPPDCAVFEPRHDQLINDLIATGAVMEQSNRNRPEFIKTFQDLAHLFNHATLARSVDEVERSTPSRKASLL